MLRRFFHSQFFAKLFYELLPATIASAVGAYLINSYFKPPAPQPQSNAELVQIMREQQALLADYLKKSTEAHQRADQAVAQQSDKLKAAERDAIQALRDAKAAELRALAAAVTRAGEASERKLAAKPAPAMVPVAQWQQTDKNQTEKAVAGEPLQLHPAASAAPQPQVPAQVLVQAQNQPQPAPPQDAATAETDGGAFARLKSVVTTVNRLPSRVFDWFADGPPPRPPVDLPRPFMKAAM
jgi:hypothetical protein